jgi:hypothetical protein
VSTAPTITCASGVIAGTGPTISAGSTGNCVQWTSATALGNSGSACGSGGGGGTTTNNYYAGALTQIGATQSGGSSSVTFSSIPTGYTDLFLVADVRGDTAATSTQVRLTLNGDTGANYDSTYVVGINSAASSVGAFASTSITVLDMPAASATASLSGGLNIQILNYAGTARHKSVLTQGGSRFGATAANMENLSYFADWRSTSAVTSLTLTAQAGNFTADSKFTLYGRGGSNVSATATSMTPQGRLTLTSNTPVLAADATAQGTIYYAPFVGNLLTVGGVSYTFSQITYALNTTAHTSGNLYDIGAYNNSGTPALCTSPAWTNSTTRSNAIAQSATFGLWVNSATLTCNLTGGTTTTSLAAGEWTYLGTFYATGNGQTGVAFAPATAGGGTANILGLSNAYNRRPVIALNRDNTASWPYGTGTWRAKNAAATGSGLNNRITFVDGLQQSLIAGNQTVFVTAAGCQAGLDLDSTSATPQMGGQSNAVTMLTTPDRWGPQLGLHFVQAVEWGSGSCTFSGASAGLTTSGFSITLEMHLPLLLPMAAAGRRRRRRANDNQDRARARAA